METNKQMLSLSTLTGVRKDCITSIHFVQNVDHNRLSPINGVQTTAWGETQLDDNQKTESTQTPAHPIELNEKGGKRSSIGGYFEDGQRSVDFVLVYNRAGETENGQEIRIVASDEKEKQRQFFERNLVHAGMELEEDAGQDVGSGQNSDGHAVAFLKIHAPFDVLCSQAEKLGIKLPLKLNLPFEQEKEKEENEAENIFMAIGGYLTKLNDIFKRKSGFNQNEAVANIDPMGKPGRSASTASKSIGNSIRWPYTEKRQEMYDLSNEETVFTPSQRLEIVWSILQQTRNDPQKRRGVERLLQKGVYHEAFPLHDGQYGGYGTVADDGTVEYSCQREKLRRVWAGWRSICRRQPLHLIRRYFGEKVGFYFAFLGFYTKMLIFPSIFGALAFLYGLWSTMDNVIVKDICDEHNPPGSYIMCPLCEPPNCEFTKLADTCDDSKWDYRMDNEATVVMACLTVVWSISMLKMWRRREAELACEWDTYDVEVEDTAIRPGYEERAPEKRRNPVTREMEAYVPPLTKTKWVIASIGITFLMLCGVGIALALLVLARVAMYGAFLPLAGEHNVECSRWFIHALIFVVVFVFEHIYHAIAGKLTSLECPRTQEQWFASFVWKLFIFELLNDFVPIAYAAWVKGKLIPTPLDLNWHSELCDTGGCLGEVTELTAVLLLLRLVLGNAAEIAWPFAKKTYNQIKQYQQANRSQQNTPAQNGPLSQWRDDYLLNEPELDSVAEEYMEMMIQFAFCTLFVAAFPLAPLVCLVNNIVEIRIDAINFIRSNRRPLPIRVSGIHIWNDFLSIICKLSVISNAGLVAFTSTIIPRLYYKYAVNPAGTYEHYTTFSMSIIHQHAWRKDEQKMAFTHMNISQCYYEDYRQDRYPYERTQHWWQVMCVRFALFSLFVLTGFALDWLADFVLDDVPARVALSIQRKKHFVTKAIEAHDIAMQEKEAAEYGTSSGTQQN